MEEADRFRTQLRIQLRFLATSCEMFDKGDQEEAIRIATTLRVLLHDTKKSTSLLRSLDATDTRIITTCQTPFAPKGMSVAYDHVSMITPYGVRAQLETSRVYGDQSIQEWLDQPLIHWPPLHFTRKSIILTVANKDGGAHVDSSLPSDYERITTSGFGSFTFGSGETKRVVPVTNIHLIALRQMAYELLNSPGLKALVEGKAGPPDPRRTKVEAEQAIEQFCDAIADWSNRSMKTPDPVAQVVAQLTGSGYTWSNMLDVRDRDHDERVISGVREQLQFLVREARFDGGFLIESLIRWVRILLECEGKGFPQNLRFMRLKLSAPDVLPADPTQRGAVMGQLLDYAGRVASSALENQTQSSLTTAENSVDNNLHEILRYFAPAFRDGRIAITDVLQEVREQVLSYVMQERTESSPSHWDALDWDESTRSLLASIRSSWELL